MKKRFMCLLCSLLFLFVCGCGKVEEVVDYPDDTQAMGTKETVSHLNYDVYGEKGEHYYTVDADVVGLTDEAFPVYSLKQKKWTNEDIKRIVDNLFEKDSVNVLLPAFASDREYVMKRIEILEKREQEYISAEREVPMYISMELKKYKEMDSFPDVAIPYQNEPKFIYMDFVYNYVEIEEKIGACVVEGKIGDDYYRVAFFQNDNQTQCRLWMPDRHSEYGNESSISGDGRLKGVEYTGTSAEIMDKHLKNAEKYLEAFGAEKYDCIAEYLSNTSFIAGDTGSSVFNTCTLYYANACNEKSRYFSEWYDEYGFYDGVNLGINRDDMYFFSQANDYSLLSFAYSEEEIGGLDAIYVDETDAWVYDTLKITMSGEKIIEADYLGFNEIGQTMTETSELLEFEKIDELAEVYLSEHPNPNGSSNIKRIQLGMAQCKNEAGQWLMVPAWYYFVMIDDFWAKPEVAVVINAIDGSLITYVNKEVSY